MEEKTAERIVDVVTAENEKDRKLKFIRFSLSDFRKPIFKNASWNERIIYWLIWFRSNDSKQQTWVTNAQISEELSISKRSVEKIVPRLKAKKWIKIDTSVTGRRIITALVDLR